MKELITRDVTVASIQERTYYINDQVNSCLSHIRSLNDTLLLRDMSMEKTAGPGELSMSIIPGGALGQIDDTQQCITNALVGLRMELERLENIINIKK